MHSNSVLTYQVAEASLDICGNDNDPFISSNSESHATAVAGEIVGAKSNGVCGTGIAYNAHVGSKFDCIYNDKTIIRHLMSLSYSLTPTVLIENMREKTYHQILCLCNS